jgi:photosystem II stability/assembly factor-like uncharacterized protein
MSAIQAERGKSLQRYDIVQSLSANEKVLVGSTQSGAVLVSSDQGKTWARQVLGPVSIIGLSTCPDGSFVGIDFNHKIWMSDAEAKTWKSVVLDKPRTPLALSCDGQGRWWVAGSGARIAVSADHGANWTVTDLNEDTQLTTIQLIDERRGIALGEFGTVVTSADGGVSWKKQTKIANDFYPYAALFKDAKEGYASGLAGQILHTKDGGLTWNKQDNATGAALYRLFLHHGQPYGVGAGGIVARLDGDTWRTMPYPDAVPVFLGSGAALPDTANSAASIAIGGPGGLVRVLGTQAN